MSFSRFCLVALLATGLAAPAVASTLTQWNVTFIDLNNRVLGTGTFNVAEPEFPDFGVLDSWTFDFTLPTGNLRLSHEDVVVDRFAPPGSSSIAFVFPDATAATAQIASSLLQVEAAFPSTVRLFALNRQWSLIVGDVPCGINLCIAPYNGTYLLTRIGPVTPDPEGPAVVPLPAGAALLPLGLLALGALRRRTFG